MAVVAALSKSHNMNSGHNQLARSLERILEEAHFSGELRLSNRKLKDFPKSATNYNLSDTVIADLSRNRFCELPEDLTTFAFLETLILYHNTIRTIPPSIKKLSSLTYLDLSSNQLSVLPREICFLPLQVLLIANNRLTSLPEELGRMEKLTDLDASCNQLTNLPTRIGDLRKLRSLSLRNNQLLYLPREITYLNLVELNLSCNRISSLPTEVRLMITLVGLNLENNPLTSPPASLCVRGLVHVFKYLETQATNEKVKSGGGNYDGCTTLRRTPRHTNSLMDSCKVKRQHVDSGYSTSDGTDKRWSQDATSKNDALLQKQSIILDKAGINSSLSIMPNTPTAAATIITNTGSAGNNLSISSAVSTTTISSSSSSSSTATLDVNGLSYAVFQNLNNLGDNQLVSEQNNTNEQFQRKHDKQTANTNSNNGSNSDSASPEDDFTLENQKSDDKNKSLGNIQTYREYKEALKQQRNMEIAAVYRPKEQLTPPDVTDNHYHLNNHHTITNGSGIVSNNQIYFNGQINNKTVNNDFINNKVIVDQPVSMANRNGMIIDDAMLSNFTAVSGSNTAPSTNSSSIIGAAGSVSGSNKKPIQKVIPSRNIVANNVVHQLSVANGIIDSNSAKQPSNESNGISEYSGYVKPCSPIKSSVSTTIKGSSTIAVKPLPPTKTSSLKTQANKTHRNVSWNHDIPAEKLSFTMRREFDRQKEETELLTQLRNIIESRLKMTLPSDIASALTDGVILCHLANFVRPRSVASIHVPSPGVPKLTMARCRRNVDNFLEACRKIGVDEELICSCTDIIGNRPDESSSDPDDLNKPKTAPCDDDANTKQYIPNLPAVLTTVGELINIYRRQQDEQQLLKRNQLTSATNANRTEQLTTAIIATNIDETNIVENKITYENDIEIEIENESELVNLQNHKIEEQMRNGIFNSKLVVVEQNNLPQSNHSNSSMVESSYSNSTNNFLSNHINKTNYCYNNNNNNNNNEASRNNNDSTKPLQLKIRNNYHHNRSSSVYSNSRNLHFPLNNIEEEDNEFTISYNDDNTNVQVGQEYATEYIVDDNSLNDVRRKCRNYEINIGSDGDRQSSSCYVIDNNSQASIHKKYNSKCDFKLNTIAGDRSFNGSPADTIDYRSEIVTVNDLNTPTHRRNFIDSLPLSVTSENINIDTDQNLHKIVTKRIEFFENNTTTSASSPSSVYTTYNDDRARTIITSQKDDNYLDSIKPINKDNEKDHYKISHDSTINLICCAADVLEGKGAVQIAITVSELFRFYNGQSANNIKSPTRTGLLRNSGGTGLNNSTNNPTNSNSPSQPPPQPQQLSSPPPTMA